MNKKILAGLIAVTMATTAGITFANGSGNGRDANNENGQKHSQMDQRGDRMARGLNLDYIFGQMSLDEQTQANVEDVLKSFQEAQRDKMSAQRDEMRAKDTKPSAEEMAELREAHQAEVTTALTDQLNMVLSPDQTSEFVEYLEAHSGKGGRGFEHGQGGRNR